MEKREALKIWTILLAIITFSLSLMGTFLVRSGILSSVHSFAVDPERGVFILAIMVVFTGGALALFAMRAGTLKHGGLFSPISREGALVLNNVLLATATGTVLIGTLYPLALESITGAKISVGPPFFNLTFGPLMIPLLLAMPFGAFLGWKRGDLAAAAERLLFAAGVAFVSAILAFAFMFRGPWAAPLGLALGVWVVAGAASEVLFRARFGQAGAAEVVRRLMNLPRSAWGGATAHAGVGIMVIGIVATTAWQSETIVAMKPGDRTEIAGYTIEFRGTSDSRGPNYVEETGRLVVTRGGALVTELAPSKRLYDAPRQATTEAGIHVAWAGDLYAILGDRQTTGEHAIRLYFNPLVRFIWLGCLIMFFGGALSLLDRRSRVGAPRKSKSISAVPAK
jgi:cytochrome c-type biogenesis protein CcmF